MVERFRGHRAYAILGMFASREPQILEAGSLRECGLQSRYLLLSLGATFSQGVDTNR